MKSVISKVLEGAMAQAVFDVSKAEEHCSLKDCLMLQILGATSSNGCRALASQLDGWQLAQLRLRLERFAYRMGRDTEAADEFYRGYISHLVERFGDARQITTLHAVADILSDKTTLSSRLFEMYGVTSLFVK
ncbi:MAG: hypothetical protein IIV16_00765 [Alistipes sp.]|nr:hypothetical protein [Alistipes sp.]